MIVGVCGNVYIFPRDTFASGRVFVNVSTYVLTCVWLLIPMYVGTWLVCTCVCARVVCICMCV